MDFGWNEDQLALKAAALEFARQGLADARDARKPGEDRLRERWRRCADFGVQGLTVPPEFGGGGYDVITALMVLEALGEACPDQGLLFSLHAHMWAVQVPLLKFGSATQKAKYFPGLCDGTLIGAHAMSEPDSGSDAFALRTRAGKQSGSYVLNGTKTFVTNAPVADVFLVFATVNRDKGMWGLTAFLVDRGAKGITTGSGFDKMGLVTSPISEVFLEDCVVPESARLGKEGQGAAIFNHSMAWERTCILASAVGGMQRQLAICLDYAKERKQFGRRIGDFQLIAAKLADMKVRLETSRLLLYRAAWAHATGSGSTLDSSIAKLFISEAAVQSALDAIQIHGGYGYMRDYDIESGLRDSIAARLYSGTSEIQRLVIARSLGLAPD